MIDNKIPNKFMSDRIQEAFEFYWKSMKRINNDIPEDVIIEFFNIALLSIERLGYIKI